MLSMSLSVAKDGTMEFIRANLANYAYPKWRLDQ